MVYTLSRKAEEDIIAIFLDGAGQFGLQQAERYHDLLENTFQFLARGKEDRFIFRGRGDRPALITGASVR